MKTAILLTNGEKQIMFTPENDTEREALKYFTPSDDIQLIVKRGSFGDSDRIYGVNISLCQGGYYRPFEDRESVMLVLRHKNKIEKDNKEK